MVLSRRAWVAPLDKEVSLAKKFFFACAGLLCLAAVYHLGTRSAAAQGVSPMVGIDWMGTNSCYQAVAIDASGQLYEDCGGTWRPTHRIGGRPVAIKAENRDGRNVVILMENGDLYYGSYYSNPPVWPPQFLTNIASGPTGVSRETWGGLKSRYR